MGVQVEEKVLGWCRCWCSRVVDGRKAVCYGKDCFGGGSLYDVQTSSQSIPRVDVLPVATSRSLKIPPPVQ